MGHRELPPPPAPGTRPDGPMARVGAEPPAPAGGSLAGGWWDFLAVLIPVGGYCLVVSGIVGVVTLLQRRADTEVARRPVGVVVSASPIPHAFNESPRTRVETGLGIFAVRGERSVMKGAPAYVIDTRGGRRFLRVEGERSAWPILD